MIKNLYKTVASLCLLAVLPMLQSCNKWLDVNPKTQIKESTQFGTAEGVKDALFTVYQNAADTSAYGTNLTFGFLDILAQRYENKSSATANFYGQAARYNYESTTNDQRSPKALVRATWFSLYKTISQANLILKNIDGSRDIVGNDVYNIVKGEALAMRAFCHFDLARLFGGNYAAAGGLPAIPYMKEFTVIPQQRISLTAVIDQCERELIEAEGLLAVNQDIDQIAGNQGSTNADMFLMYRQNHMNYWAVKAALARLYLYKGDKVNALKYALEVINSTKFSFVNIANLNTDPTNVNSDLTFSSEHIFSIYVSNLFALSEEFFKSQSLTGGENSDLFSTRAKLDAMYEASLPGYGTDIRSPAASKSLWNQLTANVVYTKKFYNNSETNVKQRLIPILKLPEMYYIAAEAAPSLAKGVEYLNVVREARLLPPLAVPASAEALDAELQKEYRKEFYGEGQLWFYYKRKMVVNIPDGVGNPMTAEKYVFPLPDTEIEFGN